MAALKWTKLGPAPAEAECSLKFTCELANGAIVDANSTFPESIRTTFTKIVIDALRNPHDHGTVSQGYYESIRWYMFQDGADAILNTPRVVKVLVENVSVYTFTFVSHTPFLEIDTRALYRDDFTNRVTLSDELCRFNVTKNYYQVLRDAGKLRVASNSACSSGDDFYSFVGRTTTLNEVLEQTQGKLCPRCNCCETQSDMVQTHDGVWVCRHCAGHCLRCDACGHMFFNNTSMVHTFEGHEEQSAYCTDCFEERRASYSRCMQCNEWFLIGSTADARLDEETGEYDDDTTPICYRCDRPVSDTTLHNYGYKPSPIFHKVSEIPEPTEHPIPLYMGIELEVDAVAESEDEDEASYYTGTKFAKRLQNKFDKKQRMFYCKTDSSLGDAGVEIVCHPGTLTYHHKWMWKDLLKYTKQQDFVAYGAECCGMHVHVNRTFFQEMPYCSPMVHFGKMMHFYQKNKYDLKHFSLRECFDYCAFTDLFPSRFATTMLESHASSRWRCSGDRRRAINLENADTVEFRLFRGTTHPTIFYANLELLDVWLRSASLVSFAAMQNWDMMTLMQVARAWDQNRYKHFLAYTLHRFPRFADTSFGGCVSTDVLTLVEELDHIDYNDF